MRKLVLFTLIGFCAQLIDGALGMAYGATSSSLLLLFGVAPAVASASIHMSEIATTAASGASHLYFKNVDRSLLLRLVVPGSISAFAGAAFLSSVPGHLIKPVVAVLLTLLGLYVLLRFLKKEEDPVSSSPVRYSGKFLIPLGLVGGFFDAVGGGGWGPIATPALLAKKGASPRKVIGTVDTSEFAIALSATLGFVLFLGWEQFHWTWVAAFVIGGVLAAPVAAYLVKVIPSRLLGVLVGGFIVLTNVRTLLQTLGGGAYDALVYAAVLILWAAALVYRIRSGRKPQETAVGGGKADTAKAPAPAGQAGTVVSWE